MSGTRRRSSLSFVSTQIAEQATGKTDQYSLVGGGKLSVVVKSLTCHATPTGPGGMLWQERKARETPQALGKSDNFQKAFDELLWKQGESWMPTVARPPAGIVRVNGKLMSLPVSATLAGGR